MADFDDVRSRLRAARDLHATAGDDLAAAAERLRRIDARATWLDRVAARGDDRYAAERESVRRARNEAETEAEGLRQRRDRIAGRLGELAGEFARFSDPREGISRLDDGVPILLMPVRLETRFAGDELWVRIYPDDCWVDGFDPVFTESELRDVRAYWAGIWQAGGVEDQERGAWAALVTAHGSGRAGWLVDTYQPANPGDRPVKSAAQDLVLTVVVTAAQPDAAAITAFWRAFWLADGAAAAIDAAVAALEAAVGAARAEEIRSSFVPVNLKAKPPAGVPPENVVVSVAFVELPDVETRQSSWSRAPRVTIPPDRFVFIGYEQGAQTVVALGAPVETPLFVGPDPGAPEDEQLREEDGDLVVPDQLRWLSDFDRAVEAGMGLRVPLTPAQAERGFDRVLVLGVRLSADEAASKQELETLLRNHSRRRTGLAVVPQGTPTNNTGATGTGFDRMDDPDASFDARRAPQFTTTGTWLDKRDGQWLAEYLGVDPALFAHTTAAGSRDQLAARALNTVLWPATFGYWMETMMSPVFTDDAVEATRAFFTRHLVAGGACPAIRIGQQPYGILPATAFSRPEWLSRRQPDARPTGLSYLARLHQLLTGIQQDFTTKAAQVSRVDGPGDPHQLLLDVLGLHPGSVEWTQRYAEHVRTVYNRLNLLGLGGLIQSFFLAAQRMLARQKLTGLGHGADTDPKILDLVFSGKHNLLKSGIVDDVPLSELAPIRHHTPDNRNYLQWLHDAATTSLDALYRQEGFTDGKRPAALLYLLIRHALQLGYSDASIRLHHDAGLFDAARVTLARADEPFLHIRNNNEVSESRYQPLFASAAQITGSATKPVHTYIGERLRAFDLHFHLADQLAALTRLTDLPTAVLERALADHVDLCSYRLDSWQLGIVNVQLALMRNLSDGSETPPNTGIHLGGYAWLEPLRPQHRELTEVELADELETVFAGDTPLLRDSENQGYVHAPSLNHAVAAAVLRNGFLSAKGKSLAVNLSSERVRTALALIEGVREGQSMASLLGYQLERGLHDRHTEAEVDKFILRLRKAFPLRAGRLKSTKPPEGVSIDAIEARDVVNGLALVEHVLKTGQRTYPFGRDLVRGTPGEEKAINAEVELLLKSYDAVADLALSEGVYQAVLGNYDRVASTFDAYAHGEFPPEPDVVRTPLSGIGMTHRLALHLDPAADPLVSPVGGIAMTPRAQGEPGLNAWLAVLLPPPSDVGCVASYRSAATGAVTTLEVTLAQLGLQPADLITLLRDDMPSPELDDRIAQFVAANADPRPDVPVTIEYLRTDTAAFSVFECLPLMRALRSLTTKSRPLRRTDLALTNEASGTQDEQPSADKARLNAVRNALQALHDDLVPIAAALDAVLGDRTVLVAGIDTFADDLTALLMRAATFALPSAGWGFVHDFRRRVFSALLELAAGVARRWDSKLADFTAKIAEAAAAATDEEKFALLAQAELTISTKATTPLPVTPAQYESDLVNVKRPAFVAKRDQFAAVAGTTRRTVSGLLGDLGALLPVDDFDFVPVTIIEHEDDVVRFAQDAAAVLAVVIAEAARRLAESQTLFDEHDATAAATAQVDALERAAAVLLGEDFRIFPAFALSTAQGDELANAHAASASGALFRHLTTPVDPNRDPVDFPVDEWLYGLARVREKPHSWEQAVMVAGALGRSEPELTAIQLPHVPDDHWLGLDFPPELALDHERLLYTAHHAVAFDPTAPQCGLLLDEWTETVPVQSVDTGITFHHDRPNSEAPQAMLLVTPSKFDGSWRWEDLVDALNETLDLAKRRAVEPKHLDDSPYAPFLPATVLAHQVSQLTIALDLALVNKIAEQ